MADIICIPRERYEYLVKCEKLVDAEFREKYNDEFIRQVKESEKEYKEGRYKKADSNEDRKKLFDSL